MNSGRRLRMKDYLTYETLRNRAAKETFTTALGEAFDRPQGILIAHHMCFSEPEFPEEIPSADTFLFDHDVAKKLFGDKYKEVLIKLALEPVETRDRLFRSLYDGRPSLNKAA
jgi:hypothetical protein